MQKYLGNNTKLGLVFRVIGQKIYISNQIRKSKVTFQTNSGNNNFKYAYYSTETCILPVQQVQ